MTDSPKLTARQQEILELIQNTISNTMAGPDFIVDSGLKGGEKIIVNGLQKARPGAVVKPVPWTPGAPLLAAPADAAKPPAAAPPVAPPAPAAKPADEKK